MTYSERLPGIQWHLKPGQEDFRHWDEMVSRNLLQLVSVLAHQNGGQRHGIVASADPVESQALLPIQDVDVPTVIRIQPGFSVSPQGQILYVDTVSELDMAGFSPGNYLVVTNYDPIEGPNKRLNEQATARVSAITILPHDLPPEQRTDTRIVAVELSAYQSAAESVTGRMVPLGVVTISEDGIVTLDTSRESYTWLRPWFTALDQEHRADLDNPHKLTFTQLDTGGTPFFRLLSEPAVLAGDNQLPGIAGQFCEELVDRSKLSTGLMMRLESWPHKLGALVASEPATVSYEAPYTYDELTNTITLHEPLPASVDALLLQKTRVAAAAPSVLGINSIEIEESSPWESVVSDGQHLPTISRQEVDITRLGAGTHIVETYIDGAGTLLASPHPVLCQSRTAVDFDVGSLSELSVTLPRPSVLRLAMSDAVDGTAVIQVTGTDPTGNEVEETFAVATNPAASPAPDGIGQLPRQLDSFELPAVPVEWEGARTVILGSSPPSSGAFVYGQKVFLTVSGIQLVSFSGTAASILSIAALLDARTLLPVSRSLVTGTVQSLEDLRPVKTAVARQPQDAELAVPSWRPELGRYELIEDALDPRYADIRASRLGPRDKPRYYVSRRIPLENPCEQCVLHVAASDDAEVTVRFVDQAGQETAQPLPSAGGYLLGVYQYIAVEITASEVLGWALENLTSVSTILTVGFIGGEDHVHPTDLTLQTLAAGTFNLEDFEGHAHTFDLTAQEVTSLLQGQVLAKTSSTDDGHAHSLLLAVQG